MSGGELDYVYSKVQQAIDDIYAFESYEIKNTILGTKALTYKPFHTPKHKRFLKHLSKVAIALKDIEWVMSGDTSPGDEITAINKVLNDRRNRKNKGH